MGFLNSSGTKVERNRLFVTNNEGSTLPPGTPVYIKSRSNDEILIGMSNADIAATMPAIGVTTRSMKVGESADILLGGFTDEIELGGLTTATVGQTLYVSQTGTLTNVQPTAGTVQSIGTILEVNAAGDTATESLISFVGAGAAEVGGAERLGGGGASFELKGDIPATGTLTFTDQPSDGDTITVGGVVITFRNTLTGSGDEVKIQSSLSSTITRLTGYFNNNNQSFTAYFTVSTSTPVYGVKLSTTSLKIVHFDGGTVGNSVTTTSSGANFSWGAPTLEGGTDDTHAVINNSGNVYMKAVCASERISHGNLLYMVGYDSKTGLPAVNEDSYQIDGVLTKHSPGSATPIGIAYDPDANGSFNTINQGETFDVLLFGVIGQVYVYVDTTTGLRPNFGETLSSTAENLSLAPNNGGGLPVATMLYPGTDSSFAADAIVFYHGGISSPYTRPTFDGVYNQNTTRLTGVSAAGVTQGCLVVQDGVSGSVQTLWMANYRHYTSADANLDIVGIVAQTQSGQTRDDELGVCINGLVSNVTVYDATGAVIPTTNPGTSIHGDVVYAGDGTINPSHVLTTDPTSGVAVGTVSTDSLRGFLQPDTFTILFQPHRL